MSEIKILLDNNEQLNTSFLESFSKILINNWQCIFTQLLGNDNTINYKTFQQFLQKQVNIKHSRGMISPIGKLSNHKFTFSFRALDNNLTFLLDLSPYMMVYNYGTRSTPLKNLQSIVKNILKSIVQEYIQKNKKYNFKIRVYLFSIYSSEYDQLLISQKITQSTLNEMIDYISKCINESDLPNEKSNQIQNLVSEVVQNILNSQKAEMGFKTFFVISSFYQQQSQPIMFFSPNWYIFGFISTGGHFGSYAIDEKYLENKFLLNDHFKTKYVFKTRFLQNWKMTQFIKKNNPDISKTVTQKHRSILYEFKDQKYENILDFLLVFRICIKPMDFKNQLNENTSNRSASKQNITSVREILRQYRIPAENMNYIIRTKYSQGWEPIAMYNSNLVENTKYRFRIQIDGQVIFYESQRISHSFLVQIYENNSKENNKSVEKDQLLSMVEKIDRINSCNFNTLLSRMSEKRSLPSRKTSLILGLVEKNDDENLISECLKHQMWGKYFKIKHLCLRFAPNLTKTIYEKLVSQLGFILGKRVNNSCFIKQTECKDQNCKNSIDQNDKIYTKILITKLFVYGKILHLKLGFMRYEYKEILSTVQILKNKCVGKDFEHSISQKIDVIPDQIYFYCRNQKQIKLNYMCKTWSLRFKSIIYKRFFETYWNRMLEKLGYEEIYFSTSQQKHYFKVIILNLENSQEKEQKIVFLR